MAFVYWAGGLAIAAALIVMFGRLILKRVKNAQLEKIYAETNNVGDPIRIDKTLSTYSRRVQIIEAVSIVLVATGVFLQTVDAWKERSMHTQNPDDRTEMSQRIRDLDRQLAALIKQGGELEKRVKKLESSHGGNGDGGSAGGGGDDHPKPPQTPGGATGKPTQPLEDVQRQIQILLKRVGKLELEMKELVPAGAGTR
jgi:hypothetical protein